MPSWLEALNTYTPLVSVAIALVGVPLALVQLRASRRQQKIALGTTYIERYWEIDDELLIHPKGSPEHKHARHRYLRLCEDQIDGARNSWFDDAQWKLWHAGMAASSQQELIRSDLGTVLRDTDFEFLRLCVGSSSGHRWSECAARQARPKDDEPGDPETD